MSVDIKLSYNLFLQTDGTWRLQVWTSHFDGPISPKIFVYQRLNSTPFETSSRDMFVNIAQATDMSEYPDDEPNSESNFFRKQFMDVAIEDSELTYKSLERINMDTEALIRTLNQL
jgi:hypothetical protein